MDGKLLVGALLLTFLALYFGVIWVTQGITPP
jgi:hypothetical protein